jgi:excisionase family DNA binding protein
MTDVLTVAEAGERFRMNPQGIRRLLRARTLNGVKIGRHYRIPTTEVDRLLREENESIVLAGGRAFASEQIRDTE